MPTVSVIIPSYNHENYIAECIQSILDQTYQDFEIIITDDASTDRTVAIIEQFTDPRIRLFKHHKNQGAPVAENNCIAHSSGKYIAVHHSDDAWERDKLERQVAFLDSNPDIGAVFTWAHIIDENGDAFEEENHFYHKIFDQPNRDRYEWLNFFFYGGNALCHPSVLIRRSSFESCGAYRSGFAQLGDLDMWVRLCLQYNIHIIPERLTYFRVRADEANASANHPSRYARLPFEFLRILDNYLEINDPNEFVKVFPDSAKYFVDGEYDLGYALAMVALGSGYKYFKLFSLQLLWKIVNDENASKTVERIYNFSGSDLTKLTAQYDVFSVVELAELRNELDKQISLAESLTSQLRERNQTIQVVSLELAGRERDLAEIRNSRAWKVALLLRRIRLRILPPNSRRTQVLRKLYRLIYSPSRKVIEAIRFKNDLSLLELSGLFDADWYLGKNPDVAQLKIDPRLHYLKYGAFEFRDPGPRFSSRFYLSTYPDVKETGINPLIHFIKYGQKEGRYSLPGEKAAQWRFKQKSSYQPKVTVVVPNYNHAAYLERRLSSIYHQTYSNYEVLLMDDCSSDESREILTDYQRRYPSITRCLFNELNSGSPFSQWKKGIENANGDLIWIAESDDFCDANFLEELVPFFADETILLSYAHSIFVDENDNRHSFAFEHFLSEIDKHKWDTSYVATAHQEVNTAMGLKNTIPNVSSAVFRRPKGTIPLLNDPNWQKMKVCGDWLFYLHFIRGGRIAYCRETNNYYRVYANSSSKKTHTQDVYYKEHEIIACAVASLYAISDELLYRNYLLLEKFYLNTVSNRDLQHFRMLFDLDKIRKYKKQRTPNILIGVFAFSFGGGEVFPIRLANMLKEKGNSVIILNGNFEPTHAKVREMVHPEIPVINHDSSVNLNELANEYGVEVTHSHHASMDRLCSMIPDTRHVVTMHGMYEMMFDFPDSIADFIYKIDQWVYAADKNVGPFKSHSLYDPRLFTKIDNGMRAPEIHHVDLQPLGITSNSFTVCMATRALQDKGWFEAIEAVRLARESTKRDIHLLLIGEGPVYEVLKNRDLPNYVHLLGYKSNLVDYFAASQLGFLPTYFKGESFPLVIIECFMAGKPIVATKIGEIPDMMLTDDLRSGGLLVELHRGKVRSEDLASALVKMINDEKFYQECAEAVKSLKMKFDLDKIADKYLALYRTVYNSSIKDHGDRIGQQM